MVLLHIKSKRFSCSWIKSWSLKMKLNRATISVFDWGCGLLPSPKISAMFSDLFCVQLFIVKTKLSGKKTRKSGTSNIKRPQHEMTLKPGDTTREYVVITVRRGAGILERIFCPDSLWNKKQFEFERTIAETKWDTMTCLRRNTNEAVCRED